MSERKGQTIQCLKEKDNQYNVRKKRTNNTMSERKGQQYNVYNVRKKRTNNTMSERKGQTIQCLKEKDNQYNV